MNNDALQVNRLLLVNAAIARTVRVRPRIVMMCGPDSLAVWCQLHLSGVCRAYLPLQTVACLIRATDMRSSVASVCSAH